MTNAEQLEHETEQTRSQIASTLDELRACMTPGQVFNRIADRVGDAGGAALVANLKRQTINNPVPVALIGAGLAWLMLGGRSEMRARALAGDAVERLGDAANAAGERMRDTADATARKANRRSAELSEAAREKAAEWSDAASRKGAEWGDNVVGLAEKARGQVASGADRATQSAADTAERMQEAAGSAAESVRHGASAGYEAISERARSSGAAVSGSTQAASQRALQTSNALVDFCRQQPLVLAGLGIAIGATIGALLPQTETEDRLMGETSDQLKERAQDLAAQQYESAKKVGEHMVKAAEGEAAKRAGQEQEATANVNRPGASASDESMLVPGHEGQGESTNSDHAKP